MDASPLALVRNWLPHLPSVWKTAILSSIGWSENAEFQDCLTEIIVQAARPILQTPAPLLKSQLQWKRDWGIIGRMWISKYTIPKAEQAFNQAEVIGVRMAVEHAIRHLASDDDHFPTGSEIPELIDVETEWTAYRGSASHIALRPSGTEKSIYAKMMAEVDSEGPTIIYLHGGAFCLMDPATHRWTSSALAKESRGRIFSIRYRLSPQNIFPAALLDAFSAYLSLISPPEGAFHDAVPASKIVIAGDSSGAGLGASLLLLLIALSRDKITIRFHGKDLTLPSPPCAGFAGTSPWLDVSRAMPSTSANMRWDIIAPPPSDAASPAFPPDLIWPSSPPRAETYCAASMVSHPLVSPLAASSEQWKGGPPIYVCVGWEGMQDETEIFARRYYSSSSDAVVVFDGFEGMPHCFSMVPWNKAGWTAMRNWGVFCRDAVTSGVAKRDTGSWMGCKGGKGEEVKLDELGLTNKGSGYERTVVLDDEMVDQRLREARRWRMELEDDMVRKWKSANDIK